VSLGRLLLSAAFVAFAFVLASWTSAQADDKGLLGVVVEAVPQVSDVTETTTELVRSTTVAAPVDDVDEVVTTSVDAVSTVAEKPVKTVDATSEALVTSTTKTLSHTTAEVVATVKTVAPASGAVIDPVVAVLAPVTDAVAAPPVSKPSEVVDQVVDALEPTTTPAAAETLAPDAAGGAAAPTASPAAPAGGQGLTGTATAPAGDPADVAAGDNSLSAVASSIHEVVRQVTAHPAGEGSGSPAPWSPSGLTGVMGGASSAGSSSSGGSEPATTPHELALPRTGSAAAQSRVSTVSAGPALDPGSRPD